jgi:hypothetical protein
MVDTLRCPLQSRGAIYHERMLLHPPVSAPILWRRTLTLVSLLSPWVSPVAQASTFSSPSGPLVLLLIFRPIFERPRLPRWNSHKRADYNPIPRCPVHPLKGRSDGFGKHVNRQQARYTPGSRPHDNTTAFAIPREPFVNPVDP